MQQEGIGTELTRSYLLNRRLSPPGPGAGVAGTLSIVADAIFFVAPPRVGTILHNHNHHLSAYVHANYAMLFIVSYMVPVFYGLARLQVLLAVGEWCMNLDSNHEPLITIFVLEIYCQRYNAQRHRLYLYLIASI